MWDQEAFRAVDTSVGALVLQLTRALVGLTTAYVVGRILTERWLDLGDAAPTSCSPRRSTSAWRAWRCSSPPLDRSAATSTAQRALLRASEAEMVERVQQQAFLRDLQDALDMGETEADALAGHRQGAPGRGAGPGRAPRRRRQPRPPPARPPSRPGSEAPGCGVETPWGCPAVRRGRTLYFESSDDLSACPRLSDRGGEPCSAVCVPITILGTPTAVIHATAPVGAAAWSAAVTDRLEGLAAQVGTRLGVLRAMAKSQLQAETDPLTGLLNRRAMEERVRHLREAGTPFALAMADLDHFKRLNDSYGHDTGDRALRTFARVLREAVRDNDVVARHGGEEFVVVLPGIDALTAAPVLHRIRERLLDAVGTALIPEFSVSIGLADSSWSSDLTDVLRAADHALMEAKAQGRDRLVIADPPAPAASSPARWCRPPIPPEPPTCTRRPARPGWQARGVGDESDLADQLMAAADLLEAVGADRSILDSLSPEDRIRFLNAAANAFEPDVEAGAARPRPAAGRRRTPRLQRDEDVLTETGIRRLRAKPVFMTPNVFPPDEPVEPDEPTGPGTERRAALLRLQAEVRRDPPLLRPAVPAVRGAQLRQAHRDGRPARPGRAAHRWAGEDRLPGRHQAAAGGRIAHRHHPVPRDAALRYSGEADFDEWCDRLEVYGLDLRHTPSVEGLCHHLSTTHPRLDYIVNNACQTVRRPPAFYEHMLELEAVAIGSAPGRGPPGARRAGRRAGARAARRAAPRRGSIRVPRARSSPSSCCCRRTRRRRRTSSPRGRSTRTSSRSTCATGTRGGSRSRRCPPSSSSRRSS